LSPRSIGERQQTRPDRASSAVTRPSAKKTLPSPSAIDDWTIAPPW
jgi:hypothetical protein